VETAGPQKLSVGKEAAYQLTLTNTGEVAAEEVVVSVELPTWAEVIGTEATHGTVNLSSPIDNVLPLQWKILQVAAGSSERLTLRVIPREGRPFDLAVRWACKPLAAQATIEVQEPKLAMHLEGPREVYFGRKELFTLKLANNGTGDAENVLLRLIPVGGGENQQATHSVGTLAAGEEKAIEVELTARHPGTLEIQLEAQADGGLRAELLEKILVRRAELKVEVQGPRVQFVGANAQYRINVANPGNASAQKLKFTVTLPPGAKYVAGLEGSHVEAAEGKLHWRLESLPPGREQSFLLRCILGTAGVNRLEVAAQADDELNAAAATTTQVAAMADLVLEVKDPVAPVPVGEEAVYELRVYNRGSKAAENVEVLVFFSNGVEPTSAQGATHRRQPGQVVFNPISSLAPGGEILLKVHAKAEVAGSHVFRAEVHSKPQGARVVTEKTTHFYQDSSVSVQAEPTAPAGASLVPPPLPSASRTVPPLPRTAERRTTSVATPAREPTPATNH
jgi:uncharacterized repeat protein (TIGR01451 family)